MPSPEVVDAAARRITRTVRAHGWKRGATCPIELGFPSTAAFFVVEPTCKGGERPTAFDAVQLLKHFLLNNTVRLPTTRRQINRAEAVRLANRCRAFKDSPEFKKTTSKTEIRGP